MKRKIKIGLFVLFIPLLFLIISCSSTEVRQVGQRTFELALVSDSVREDRNAFIQGCWEGMSRYARENGISARLYHPNESNQNGWLEVIDLAVENGALIIVCPGFNFVVPVYIAQDKYPDVRFIMVDSVPQSPDGRTFGAGSNSVGILYAEDQAGFLAGYAAVRDGYRRLGFMGGVAVNSVIRFGYGFIQGAEYAAVQLGLPAGNVTINYHYTGDFIESQKTQDLASSWYANGVEVIFACGGALGKSVITAAEQLGKKVIGVDVDQSSESSSVITSAMKGLQSSIYTTIANYYNGRFPGGQIMVFSASSGGVALPMATSRFNSFNQKDYDAIYRMLVHGDIPRIIWLDNAGRTRIIPVTRVRVEEIL